MSHHNSNNILKSGFTIVEILIIAPIVILVIGIFITIIVNMTGDVLTTRGANVLAFNIQNALDRIKQDVALSNSYLATNSITLTTPQGYNDDTTNFHNADATNGAMLILNTYVTTSNPLSSTRNIVYTTTPNACNTPQVNQNQPVFMNIVYFVKNGTLWRRVIAPSNYTTVGCSVPWQQPSCSPAVSNAFCKTQDTRLIDGLQSNSFNVNYYATPSSTTANTIAIDSGQTDNARQTALGGTSTVSVTINITSTVAGRDVSQSGTTREVSPNYTQPVDIKSCSTILNTGGSIGSGIYTINPAGTALQAYCDMTTSGGGWTLILCNPGPYTVWDLTTIYSLNTASPSISAPYSILNKADQIKSNIGGNLQYRIDAVSFGHWGGVWQAPFSNTFVGTTVVNNATNIQQYDTWTIDTTPSDTTALTNIMPWVENIGQLLSTWGNAGSWWGTLVTGTSGWTPAPYINPEQGYPGIIWYWVK